VDTLRADHLRAYGYERETSPNIDTLARSGVRFARTRSQASWTKPSMASIWTAIHPSGTGVMRFSHGLPEVAEMPAERLRAEGYLTAGIWRNGWVSPGFGFAQGFDLYLRPPPTRLISRRAIGGMRPPAPVATDMDATESTREFLRTFRDRRFFLYVHFMDVHQYVYDESSTLFGTGYADAYDNAVHWVDMNVGLILEELDRLDLRESTLVVVAADHGEEFRDHGGEGHGKTLYDEVTHVPLVFSQPGHLPSTVVVEDPVQNVDIWPTIFDLIGLLPIDGAQGRSLRPLIWRGEQDDQANAAPPRTTFSQIDRIWGRRNAEPRPLVSVAHGGYRLIHPLTPPGSDELYDLRSDPSEHHDLSASHPDVVRELTLRIDRHLARRPAWPTVREVELDDMGLHQLRALGYLGVGQGDQPASNATEHVPVEPRLEEESSSAP
jgi:arylsulfatase A-like enzyme